jgi:hypothetical protein
MAGGAMVPAVPKRRRGVCGLRVGGFFFSSSHPFFADMRGLGVGIAKHGWPPPCRVSSAATQGGAHTALQQRVFAHRPPRDVLWFAAADFKVGGILSRSRG